MIYRGACSQWIVWIVIWAFFFLYVLQEFISIRGKSCLKGFILLLHRHFVTPSQILYNISTFLPLSFTLRLYMCVNVCAWMCVHIHPTRWIVYTAICYLNSSSTFHSILICSFRADFRNYVSICKINCIVSCICFHNVLNPLFSLQFNGFAVRRFVSQPIRHRPN